MCWPHVATSRRSTKCSPKLPVFCLVTAEHIPRGGMWAITPLFPPTTLLLLARIHIIWCPLPCLANNLPTITPCISKKRLPDKNNEQQHGTGKIFFNSWHPATTAQWKNLIKKYSWFDFEVSIIVLMATGGKVSDEVLYNSLKLPKDPAHPQGPGVPNVAVIGGDHRLMLPPHFHPSDPTCPPSPTFPRVGSANFSGSFPQ